MERTIENQATDNQVEEAAVQEYFDDLAEKAKVYEESKEAEEAEEVIERPYTLRKLGNGDFWTVITILKKILPDDMAMTVLNLITGKMSAKSAGMLAIMNIATEAFKNLDRAQAEVDAWCADLIGDTVEALNSDKYEFGTTPMIIMDVVTDTKNVPFFKVLSKFF